MMKKIIGIFMLIAGIVIAVAASSASFAYFEADRGVHIKVVPDDSEFIDLKPLQPYAYINEQGTLTVDISTNNGNYSASKGFGKGVSPDSIYVFEHMFGVSNHLWENTPICVVITWSTSAFKLFNGTYTGSAGASPLKIIVQPGGMANIGMLINSTGLANCTSIDEDITIKAYADLSKCQP